MSLETEYLGRAITYNDNSDMWVCRALDMEAKTLSALKAKVGQHDADSRRVDLPLLKIGGGWSGKIEECRATLIADEKAVWCNIKGTELYRGATRETNKREKIAIEHLAEDTAETRIAISLYETAKAAVKKAQQRERDTFAAIPRVSLDRIKSMGVKTA